MDNRKLDPEGWNPTIRSRMDHEESPILNPSNSQNEYWMKFTKLAAGTSYLSRDFVVDHLICTEHGIYHKLADNHRGAKAHYNKDMARANKQVRGNGGNKHDCVCGWSYLIPLYNNV